ncbi:HNH endonuclease family protein [Vibrio parahaemolyticus]|uniref:HNH endonuclease family protein n=1 Tax=Vibrio parahaemolyticus TaxID=670 RepID=UPI002150F2D1|nr:HNH endonuclease family protein [Vibrio parahaemolyticus]
MSRNTTQDAGLIVDVQVYLAELERLSERYFKEITEGKRLAYSEENPGVLHRGTGVHNFIFNRLDYLRWKRLSDNESFDGIGKKELGKHFDDFQFSFRTSVEHYFPQTDPSGARKMKDVDRFGNLCLILPSSNSRLTNYSPQDKKKFYQENNRAESLKQAIMMSYDAWEPEGVGYENILNHEAEMIKVLCNQ